MSLSCPHCRFEQQVRPDGISIFCHSCHKAIDIQLTLHPAPVSETKALDAKTIACFRCQAELSASAKAQSVMCKKCGYRNDMQDYHVKNLLSQNLETHGLLNIAPGGTVLNSTAKVKNATIHGKFIGRLTSSEEVTLKSGSTFEGGLKAARLVLESNVQLSIKKEFQTKKIVIAGHFYGNIQTSEYVMIKKGAVVIGNIQAKNAIFEEGATFCGKIEIGKYISNLI